MIEPWDIIPAFTLPRLQTLAKILVDTRQDALRDHDLSKGDTNWGLGCRVYERTCFAIELATKSHEWLTVLDHPLHFVFTLDGMPMRFGRGDADEPNPRLLRRGPNEQEAHQLALEFADDPGLLNWLWRLIVEVDSDTLVVARVVLIQVSSDGVVKEQWTITLPPEFLKDPPATSARGSSRQLPKPKVTPKTGVSPR